MIIDIDKDYFIEKDEYSFTLKERKHRLDKLGNEVTVTYGYFRTLESALNKLKNVKIEQRNAGQLISLKDYIDELKAEGRLILDYLEGGAI